MTLVEKELSWCCLLYTSPLPSIENGRLEYAIDRFAFEDEDTLRDIHFTLDKGQTLGLVGQTGSGKTALVKLLLREHDVNQGAIYLNGHNIRDYRLSDLRSSVSYTHLSMIYTLILNSIHNSSELWMI